MGITIFQRYEQGCELWYGHIIETWKYIMALCISAKINYGNNGHIMKNMEKPDYHSEKKFTKHHCFARTIRWF